MTKSLPAKVKMLCLAEVCQTFFHTIQENKATIEDMLNQMKALRQEEVQIFWKSFAEKKDTSHISQQEASSFLQGMLGSFEQKQKKTYEFLEQGIGKQILENLSKQALEKALPQVASLSNELEQTKKERDALLLEREKLTKTLEDLSQECQKIQEQRDLTEKNANRIKAQAKSLQDSVKAIEDYQTIISRIRKELEMSSKKRSYGYVAI